MILFIIGLCVIAVYVLMIAVEIFLTIVEFVIDSVAWWYKTLTGKKK